MLPKSFLMLFFESSLSRHEKRIDIESTYIIFYIYSTEYVNIKHSDTGRIVGIGNEKLSNLVQLNASIIECV